MATKQNMQPTQTINFEEESNDITQPVSVQTEYNLDDFSDTAVGDTKKYIRPNLSGKTVKILSAKVYSPNKEDEEIVAIGNANVKYKKARFLVTFDLKNTDGMNNREYYSGAICFIQKDGKLSEPKFYKTGAESQVAKLWEEVAKYKKVNPEEMSPKTFISVLNSGISVKLTSEKIKFNGKITEKNIISQVVG